MSTIRFSLGRRALALLTLVLLGFAVSSVASTPPVAAARTLPVRAFQVVVAQTGGFAGVSNSYSVDVFTPNANDTLALAASTEFRALAGAYQPADLCCDRFSYRVTVYYFDGTSKSVATTDGGNAPTVLYDVITQTKSLDN